MRKFFLESRQRDFVFENRTSSAIIVTRIKGQNWTLFSDKRFNRSLKFQITDLISVMLELQDRQPCQLICQVPIDSYFDPAQYKSVSLTLQTSQEIYCYLIIPYPAFYYLLTRFEFFQIDGRQYQCYLQD